MSSHGVEKIQRVCDVIAEVLRRTLDGLSNIRERGEVYDGGELMFIEDSVQGAPVREVDYFQRAPADSPRVPVPQIVEHHRFAPAAGELLGRMAADISGSACNQNFHD